MFHVVFPGKLYFNPRSHERSDLRFFSHNQVHLYFNPRSHERSDLIPLLNMTSLSLFQSTLPREERRLHPHPFPRAQIFQSTLPREERPITGTAVRGIKYFNPRSHERSDQLMPDLLKLVCIFQSTLPREERPVPECDSF